MKKLAIPVTLLFSFLLSTYTHDDVIYPKESVANSKYLQYNVPSDYPTIQSALDAAVAAGGQDATIVVEQGEYRELVIAAGLKNLKLIGKNARILPPSDFVFSDPPMGDNYPPSSFKLINCENYLVEGFTFVGDDFAEGTLHSYPMGNSILSLNSSGTIANNIVFNYLDGIYFQVDGPRWMKGNISDNYIHNCWWSGIFAAGSTDLKIHNNKIAFTIPKELSISVGIWTNGGTGIIAENQIRSYRDIDYYPDWETSFGIDLWSEFCQFSDRTNYRVMNNTFENTADGIQAHKKVLKDEKHYDFIGKSNRINNHFINVNQYYLNSEHPEIVMVHPERH